MGGFARLTGAVAVLTMVGIGGMPARSGAASSGPDPLGDPATAVTDQTSSTETAEAAERAASEEAKRTGAPVVVEELTTPTSEVTALPSGLFSAHLSSAPVRVQENGRWTELDASLRRLPDGRLAPRSDLGDLIISGGGAEGSVLASYTSDQHSFVVKTPVDLPTPSVDGVLATYAEVFPGVDLVVKASTEGFSHNWVVKTTAATQDPRVRDLALPLEIDGLETRRENGGISFVDGDGVRQFWTPAPMMWDSASARSDADDTTAAVRDSAAAVADGPTQGDEVASVTAAIDGDELRLRADQSLLDNPAAVLPIVIDPVITSPHPRNGWTAVWNNFPAKSFWKTDHSLGAGYEGYQQFKVVRSYFRFNIDALGGKHIVRADMNVRQIHAASCSARPTQVYRTGAIGSGTTWNKQPKRYELQSANSLTTGCGSGAGKVGWNVTPGIKTLVASSAATANFMIRAKDESDKIAWKQFDDSGADVVVQYVTPPKVPTGLFIKAASKTYPCGTSEATAPVIGASTVIIGATVSSVDAGATLNGVFRRTDLGTGLDAPTDAVGTNATPGVQSQMGWTTGTVNKSQRFQVRTRVSWSSGGATSYLYSAFNGVWCYFKTDVTSPPPPTITPISFAECASPESPDQCPALGQTHTSGTVTVKSATSDGVRYHWRLNGGAEQSIATTAGAERTLTLNPDRVVNNLVVWTEDGANKSLPSYLTFRVDKRQPEARWAFDDSSDLSMNSGTAVGSFNTDAVASLGNGRVNRAVRFSGASARGGLHDVPTVGSDFTVATWARVDSNTSATLVAAPSGANGSAAAFELGYDAVAGRWTAGRRSADNSVTAASSPTAFVGGWTHLTARYQASTNKITLYVNGVARDSVTYVGTMTAGVEWRIGCGSASGTDTRCLSGALDEVQLYSAALSDDEIVELANPVDAVSGRPILSSAALWGMDDAPSSSTADEAIFGATLALAQAAQNPDGTPRDPFGPSADTTQAVLTLPGVSGQQARTAHPVADSMGSFSVMAHVRPSDPSRSMVIAQQRGVNRDSWTLGYRAAPDGSGGRWVFQRSASDSGAAPTTEVRSTFQPDVSGDFTYVQGVYDARVGEIALYINGQKFEDEPDPATEALQDAAFGTPWVARSILEVGNGPLNGTLAPFEGEIDQVFVLAGALDAQAAVTYYADLWTQP